jgi:hypothetical protein
VVERYFGDLSWNRQKRRIVQEVDDVEESRSRLISLRKSGKSFRTGANPRFTLEGYIRLLEKPSSRPRGISK